MAAATPVVAPPVVAQPPKPPDPLVSGTGWQVDEFYLDEPKGEIEVPLRPDAYPRDKPLYLWRSKDYERQVVIDKESNLVVSCRGKALLLQGKPVLVAGDSQERVKRVLGTPELRSASPGCGSNPEVLWVYHRGTVTIVARVTNDDYLRGRNFPPCLLNQATGFELVRAH